MRDGVGVCAGQDDLRQGGQDLMHNVQKAGRAYTHPGVGGPVKEALEHEMQRHGEARNMRLEHLKNHYER